MNSGGAHCLKYGVTTNNLLGVTMVLMDGTVIELGGRASRRAGARPARGGLRLGGAARRGDRGDAADPEEARGGAAGADRVRLVSEVAGACVSDIIKAGVLPVAIEFMDRPCIRACEDFAHAGYPDVEALLIVEVEGSEAEIAEQLGQDRGDRAAARPGGAAREQVGGGERADLEGAQVGLRRDGADRRLHLPRRHDPGERAAASCCGGSAR